MNHPPYKKTLLYITSLLPLLGCNVETDSVALQKIQESVAPQLFHTTTLGSGGYCETGGFRLQIGKDVNLDGRLQESEITKNQYICNGHDGQDGNHGIDGTNGNDGDNGLNSLTSHIELPPGEQCLNGGFHLSFGLDDNANNILDNDEVDHQQTLCHGEDGYSSLINSIAINTDDICVEGGLRIDSGLDNGDGTGTAYDLILQTDEVDQTQYLCHGEAGADGQPGNSGLNGIPGLNAISKNTLEEAGEHCAAGGYRIDYGLDDGAGQGLPSDYQLHADEILDTYYLCHGTGSSGGGLVGTNVYPVIATSTPVPSGSPCSGGGFKVVFGMDNGDGAGNAEDGLLHLDEVDQTEHLCIGDTNDVADSDDDGIPDLLEKAYGLDAFDPVDAGLDLDQDGWSNLDEYRFGTSMDDSEDNPLTIEQPTGEEPVIVHNSYQKVLADDISSDNHFGNSLDIDGDYAVIGDRNNAAYVFFRNEAGRWTQQAKLTPTDGKNDDRYGWKVAISGNTVAIGSEYNDEKRTDSGAVYMYRRDAQLGWTFQSKLIADDSNYFSQFGRNLSLSENILAIYAYSYVSAAGYSGVAYIYTKDSDNNWVQQAKVTPLENDFNYSLGFYGLDISERTLVMGAHYENAYTGSVLVFHKNEQNQWQQQTKLTAEDGNKNDYFGYSVSIDQNTIVIGANGVDDARGQGRDFGAAYVFTRDQNQNWNQQAKLTASDARPSLNFGRSVSIQDGKILMGATGYDSTTRTYGAVYLFQKDAQNQWIQESKFNANDSSSRIGENISVSGNTLVIGAPNSTDDTFYNNGAAYFFPIKQEQP